MREDAFTALLDAADRQPVRVVDLLRAWREAGHGAGALAPLAAEAVAGGPGGGAWAGCLRALEQAFAPDELAHLTAGPNAGHRILLATTRAELQARLERTARQADCGVQPGEGPPSA